MKICFDFDGVIHSYTSAWEKEDHIPDMPIPGCRNFLECLKSMGAEIYIHSTRCCCPEGRGAIVNYMTKHKLIFDDVVEHKPVADLYIDDRAIPFNGKWHEIMKAVHLSKAASGLCAPKQLSSKQVDELNELFAEELKQAQDAR